MDFKDTPAQAAWRQEVRSFLEAERDHFPLNEHGELVRDRDVLLLWRKKLAARGWIAPPWPKEYGGLGLGVMEQFILNEELAEAGVNQLDMGVSLIGPTLIVHGSDEQKREHLPRILAADVIWCQGFSEPGAGSDLASLQARAVRDGDDWIINGQKIWTSGAHHSDWIFMLARTDPEAPKHRGISMFLIDMKTPGITVRPLINLAGLHGFNETFFEDVRVPASALVGEVNRGWYVSTTTLDFERSAVGNAVGARKAVEAQIALARSASGTSTGQLSPALRKTLAERWVEAAVAKLLSFRVATMQDAGLVPNYEASIAKLYASELNQRIAQTGVEVLGTFGLLTGGSHAPAGGRWGVNYMTSLSQTIAGGTSEIQRNIVATRGLGLPRA